MWKLKPLKKRRTPARQKARDARAIRRMLVKP